MPIRQICIIDRNVINNMPVGPHVQMFLPVYMERFSDLMQWESVSVASSASFCLLFLLSGKAAVSLNEQQQGMLPAGDAFVAMHAGTVSIIASENTPLAGWALCVSGGGVPAFLSELGFSNKNVFVSIFNNQLINNMLDQCFQLCEHIRNASDISTVSYYIKGCYASLCTVGVLRGNSEHIQSSAISRIINLMRSRITGTLSIAEMATAYGCSCSRFLSVYRRHMGVSPGQHFLQMKIRYAAQLLLTTALPLIEIAHRVGYDDYRYFTRIFKKCMHTTPHSFRKAHT